MKIDRAHQRELLTFLSNLYPQRDYDAIFKACEGDEEKQEKVRANLLYLEEHGLIESGLENSLDGHFSYFGARITARGLDFLENDGGLSAILGTVTVKLHADTITALLADRIDAAPDLPAEEKSRLKTHLATLSTEALKALAKHLVEKGLDQIPNVALWLSSLRLP